MTAIKSDDVNGWIRNPGYEIEFDPLPARLRVEFENEIIADTQRAMLMLERGHAPAYYLPQSDIAMHLLQRTDRDTYCPYKGHASYWNVRVGAAVAENAAWAYLTPRAEMAQIAGYLAFYWDRMHAWYEDGVKVSAPRKAAAGPARV